MLVNTHTPVITHRRPEKADLAMCFFAYYSGDNDRANKINDFNVLVKVRLERVVY